MNLFGRVQKEHWNEILGILIVIFAIWLLISLIGFGGNVGNNIKNGLEHLMGYVSYVLVVLVAYWGVGLFIDRKRGVLSGLIGSFSLLISGLMLFGVGVSESYNTSGLLGYWLNNFGKKWIGVPGLILVGLIFFILGITLSAELTVSNLFYRIYSAIRRKEQTKTKRKPRYSNTVKPKPQPQNATPKAQLPLIQDSRSYRPAAQSSTSCAQ